MPTIAWEIKDWIMLSFLPLLHFVIHAFWPVTQNTNHDRSRCLTAPVWAFCEQSKTAGAASCITVNLRHICHLQTFAGKSDFRNIRVKSQRQTKYNLLFLTPSFTNFLNNDDLFWRIYTLLNYKDIKIEKYRSVLSITSMGCENSIL